jgi:hypothetical protein
LNFIDLDTTSSYASAVDVIDISSRGAKPTFFLMNLNNISVSPVNSLMYLFVKKTYAFLLISWKGSK